jgi:hypothetical protein
MTSSAAIAGMLGGTLMHVALTGWGYYLEGEFRAFEFMGLNPFIWDLAGSLIACAIAVLLGPQPRKDLVQRYFGQPAA